MIFINENPIFVQLDKHPHVPHMRVLLECMKAI